MHDDNTLDAFLDNAWKQLLTKCPVHALADPGGVLHQGIPLHGAGVHLWPKIGAGPGESERAGHPHRRGDRGRRWRARHEWGIGNLILVRHSAVHRAVAAAGHCCVAGASASPGVLDGTTSACARVCASPDLRPQMNACAMQRNALVQYASRVGKFHGQ